MAAAVGPGMFEALDDTTSALIIEIQLQDIEQLLTAAQGKGKAREGVVTEWEQILLLHRDELRRAFSIIKDRQMSRSMSRAVQTDANALVASMQQELQEQEDRRMACELGGVAFPPPPPNFAAPTPPQTPRPSASAGPSVATPSSGPLHTHPATPATKLALNVTPPLFPPNLPQPSSKQGPANTVVPSNARPPKRPLDDITNTEPLRAKRVDTGEKKGIDANRKHSLEVDESTAGPSHVKRLDTGKDKVIDLTNCQDKSTASYASEQHPNDQSSSSTAARTSLVLERSSCVSCGDEFVAFCVASVPCGHEYCQTCLQTVLRNSLTDEALFPPRCCRQPFDFDGIRRFLTPELLSQYHEKKIEFRTANRIYCSNLECSLFLHPENISVDEAFCPKCFKITCTMCKGPEHLGDCPNDIGIQQVIVLAAQEGWRRCDKCSRMIDLKLGCNHITFVTLSIRLRDLLIFEAALAKRNGATFVD